jgi:UDP-glucuronate 4-epimerase
VNILLTGAAGFIGHHVLLKLVQNTKNKVIGIDNLSDYYDINLKYSRLQEQGIENLERESRKIVSFKYPNYKFIKLDVRNFDNLISFLANEEVQYIVHLAAQPGVRYSLENPHSYVTNNISGFLNILEFARYEKVKHLIYASSSSVYGLNESIPFEEFHSTDHPASLYGATKKANEVMAHSYSHLFQIPTTGLRLFTVYGPWGRPDMAPMIFAKSISEGKAIDVYNYGKMMRDFTYVEDIAHSILSLLTKPPLQKKSYDHLHPVSHLSSAPYCIYNVGNSNPVRLMQFIKEIETNFNTKANINFKQVQAGEMIETYANNILLAEAINFRPLTTVKIGVKRFVDWYKIHYSS